MMSLFLSKETEKNRSIEFVGNSRPNVTVENYRGWKNCESCAKDEVEKSATKKVTIDKTVWYVCASCALRLQNEAYLDDDE